MSRTVDAPRSAPRAPSVPTRVRSLLLGRDVAIVVLLLVVLYVGTATVPYFGTPTTAYFLLLDVFPILLIALPMTFVIITGEIDLSVASMLGLSSVLVGVLFQAGVPVPVAAVVAVLAGVAGGMLNGFLVTTVGLPSLAVTIGTLALYRGLAVGLLGTTAVTGFPSEATQLTGSRLGGGTSPVPTVVVLFVVLAVVAVVLLHFTPVGRAVYAAGLNDEAAVFSGVDTARLKFWLLVATGAVSALAGVYWTLRYNSARGDNALGLELSVIAAVLVGGVSIFGGRGALPGVIAAVLLIGALRSVLRLANVTDDVINIATGALLIASVLFPRLLTAIGVLRARAARPGRAPAAPAP